MGEVYRADDLRLDQPVALKFLPYGLGGSEDRLARFYREVRVARQVSHAAVCRVSLKGAPEPGAAVRVGLDPDFCTAFPAPIV